MFVLPPEMTGQAGKLHAFRLPDVPVEVREKYALTATLRVADNLSKRRAHAAWDPEVGWMALDRAVGIVHTALFPSESVYRVRQAAWEDMLVEAAKLQGQKERLSLRPIEEVAA